MLPLLLRFRICSLTRWNPTANLLALLNWWLLPCFLLGCAHDAARGPGQGGDPSPCTGQSANPLSFRIQEQTGSRFFDTDTTYPRTVAFRAPRTYVAFQWTIGNDPTVFKDSVFTLEFNQAVGTIPVRLIARRALNTACFPHDDGVDTLTKVLTIVPLDPTAPRPALLGKFNGATTDAPADTFTVRVFTAPKPSVPTDIELHLQNLNKGCLGTAIDVAGGYRSVVFSQGNFAGDGCKKVAGVGFLDPGDRNRIRFEYTQEEPIGSGIRQKKVFLGRRVR